MALFTAWVLSPFVALGLASVMAKQWASLTRAAVRGLTIVSSLGTLAPYAVVALGPPREHTAFVFVVVPPLSWLVIAIVVGGAAFISRRMSRR